MVAALCAIIAMADPQQSLAGQSDTQPVKIPFQREKWNLLWADEFDQPGLPDPAKWNYEEGYVRNNEAQFYTRGRKENARVENGKLIIEARLDNWNGNKITSASLTTEGKHSVLYGRIEIRAKIPTGKGTWPAFWTLGENIRQVGWPKCGEIDVLENVGFDPSKVHANVHTEAYNHTKRNGKGNNLEVGDAPHTAFNIYAAEWYPDRIEFFFNDTRYFVYRKESDHEDVWPFAKPHYLILNLAIGGAWGGAQGVDESLLPHRFEIDYVRHYQPR